MKLRILRDPEMVKAPILESPGFAKKGLSDFHLDLARRCAAGCSYCSSNIGYPMRVNKQRLVALAREQLGEEVDPTRAPDVSIVWDADEVMRRLKAQVMSKKGPGWGQGKTLMVSQLTDAFLGYPLSSGLTRRALDRVLLSTSFRVRILTKSDVVGREPWLSYFKAHPGRFVVGLSVGTLDDAWAAKVEPGTSKPSARLRALRRLQDAGVPTFGMLCPIFPDASSDEALGKLLDAIRPEQCETVWAEPFNDRDNWQAVREGYAVDGDEWTWFTDVCGRRNMKAWSAYATSIYATLWCRAVRDGWLHKLAYLLYEDQITAGDAWTFRNLEGVLLQSKPIAKETRGAIPIPNADAGYSPNPWIRKLQTSPAHGRVEPPMDGQCCKAAMKAEEESAARDGRGVSTAPCIRHMRTVHPKQWKAALAAEDPKGPVSLPSPIDVPAGCAE